MPPRVGRIRRQLCSACLTPCEKMLSGSAPYADPAQACELGRFGAYDLAAVTAPLPPPPPFQARPEASHPWGPARWDELHAAAYAGRLTPAWLDAYTARLPNIPCGCRNHWKTWREADPLPGAASPAEQFAWAWRAHNAVNLRLGKPAFPLKEAWTRQAERMNLLRPLPNNLDTDSGIGSVRV